MFNLTVKINHLTGEEPDELNLRFARRETAREMASQYLGCEDVYCVEMTNGLTGEVLYYEYKY